MLFKIMIAMAAYYIGKSNIGLDEFMAIVAELLKLDDGK